METVVSWESGASGEVVLRGSGVWETVVSRKNSVLGGSGVRGDGESR